MTSGRRDRAAVRILRLDREQLERIPEVGDRIGVELRAHRCRDVRVGTQVEQEGRAALCVGFQSLET
jgi:hypothetical protein